MMRAGLQVAATAAIALVTVACNGTGQLKTGMQEADVVGLLGQPIEVITEPSLMGEFLAEEEVKTCVPKATKVLVYDRWINDVGVAIDAKGTVVCFEVVSFF